MKYDQLIIYYFSGTGNARNAARWIINIARERGIKTHLINIDRLKTVDMPEITSKTLIGFCSPTHGFNLPPIAINFLLKIPKTKKTDAFILNTRAGMKLNKLFLPGISGIAQLLAALILLLKGFRIIGMQPLDLPSNWLLVHPGLKQKVVDSIYTRCNRIVNNFATNIFNGKRKYKALLSVPIDLTLIPISLAYYFIGRFFLAKTLIATNACTNCNLCISQCPVEAIKPVNDKPFWTYKCESCMRCVNLCPHRAIETTHGFSSLLIFVSSLVISPLLLSGLKYLDVLDFVYKNEITKGIWLIIDVVFLLIFIFISYGVLHFSMKFKFVNTIITYTSLSKYKFWRRYKAPKVTINL